MTEDFTTEGMYKELAEGHIAGRLSAIKSLEANAKELGDKTLHKEAIARLKLENTELKKVKETHKGMREKK